MIRHTVVFKLKNPPASPETNDFFTAARKLAAIPGVRNFECLKQISPKNNFDFGLSMEFDNATLYEQYNHHPDHVHFVQTYWAKNVDDFLEIDYEPLP
ncbi:Dabb family protein [Spirosoma spitsbergense]|jgi:hypothetical protein|uniref:Dabb family protein n=1 Tax=Spirosoma spitsbergense TaxID=431554 RepID=UPI00036704F6|nr:Dabb family protein [Spirosoma spitsbergense]